MLSPPPANLPLTLLICLKHLALVFYHNPGLFNLPAWILQNWHSQESIDSIIILMYKKYFYYEISIAGEVSIGSKSISAIKKNNS